MASPAGMEPAPTDRDWITTEQIEKPSSWPPKLPTVVTVAAMVLLFASWVIWFLSTV